METLEKVWVLYDEMFCDELSIKLLYQKKDSISEFVDENENPISKSAVAVWIMENYYNDRKFVEYCKERKGKYSKQRSNCINIMRNTERA